MRARFFGVRIVLWVALMASTVVVVSISRFSEHRWPFLIASVGVDPSRLQEVEQAIRERRLHVPTFGEVDVSSAAGAYLAVTSHDARTQKVTRISTSVEFDDALDVQVVYDYAGRVGCSYVLRPKGAKGSRGWEVLTASEWNISGGQFYEPHR